jgi:two-component system OmpR family sensor kinase
VRLPAGLSRLSLRWKLTLAYAGAIAVGLTGVGLFLYLHFESGLDSAFDQALRTRAAEIASVTRHGVTPTSRRVVRSGEGYGQVLDPGGRVLAGSGPGAAAPLLSGGELRRARTGELLLERDEADRLLARPLRARPGYVVVAGASLAQREHALETLGAGLLVGIPMAVLLAAAAAYAVAAGALRPVDLMRRRARSISAGEPGARLPLPAAQDEVHRLGATLNEMLGRLQAAMERERAFVADASHELRTPLSVLRAEIDVALRGPGEPEDLRRALVNAGAETDRLAALAEDLLVLAREDQGGLALDARRADADALLEAVARRFATRARAERRAIEVEVPAGLTLRGDARWLEQALGNLVDNALRHGAGAIRLRAGEADGRVELHVIDEGRGFPDAFLPVAFDRFTRGDPARSSDGAGLGLAIVRAVARAHGGAAGAGPGTEGTDVWIALPAAS